MARFAASVRLPVPAEEAFAWHARPGAFERLAPPWERVTVECREGGLDGGRVVLRVPVGPFRVRWVADHRGFEEGRHFKDVQAKGPFARWEHAHRFEPAAAEACTLFDEIDFELPGGVLGRLGTGGVKRKLARLFAYRHTTTANDLALHHGRRSLRVAVTGASGLLGSHLAPFLTTGGHAVLRIGRGEDAAARWDPAAGEVPRAALEGLDAVVHLAGEPIAAGRWTGARRRRIRESRTEGTRLLASALAEARPPPRVLVCASAVGFYGDRGDETLDEASAPGEGFLADVCRAWEEAARPAREAGIRVVHLRFGTIVTPAGGALARLLLPFRLGLGGRLGAGTQYFPWVAPDDALGAIHHALFDEDVAGPVNVVAPDAVTNAGWTRVLARVLRRPAVLPVPAAVLRLALGGMARELLLASARVEPRRLRESGYAFRHPGLEGALRHLLGRTS